MKNEFFAPTNTAAMLYIEQDYNIPIAKAQCIKHKYMTVARIYLDFQGSLQKFYLYQTAEIYVRQRGTTDYVQVRRQSGDHYPQLNVALDYLRRYGFRIANG